MGDEVSIRVNFSNTMPLFPLDSVVLLPQQVMPLHVFEPRYRQMVEHALDGPGQIAMATFNGKRWQSEYHGNPPVRPAVCVGQIVQHEKLPDGRYNMLLQGVCRATIAREHMPDERHLYRRATLEPLGVGIVAGDEPERVRAWIDEHLAEGELSRLAVAEQVSEYVRNDEVPTDAALELVAFAILNQTETRYRLLAEGDVNRRARMIRAELERLRSLISRAMKQHPEDWPKGVSWN